MNESRIKRKLSAILSADIQGYSRLIGQDDVGTVRRLKNYRKLMAELIEQYGGRVVDSPGDNLLAEFASILDATECAIKIQAKLRVRNAELPANRRMEFRIGLNLGDVIEDEDRIYGDGVNIAARMEGLANAGGINISGTVYDHIKNKFPLKFEYLGEKFVKNIVEPVRVYKLKMVTSIVDSEQNTPPLMTDKPSIAVLPFNNMSGDPEQEYFSDGMTEDLITDLSQVSGLFVISRNSVFTYKGKPVKIQDVGRELGVRYVLEGSVRKMGNKVRITAQLVDAVSGGHLWAERYDRDLEELFILQDEVLRKIVSVLAIRLTEDEQICRACKCKNTCNMEAYDYYLRGLEFFNQLTKAANARAREMFAQSMEIDPQYAPAISQMGETYLNEWAMGWESDFQTVKEAFKLALRAIALDDALSEAHCLLANVYLWKRDHEQAAAEANKAITLEPNNADMLVSLGAILTWTGKPEEAIILIEKAMWLNPKHPDFYLWNLGHANFIIREYDAAISAFERSLNINSNFHPSHFYLAATYSEMGQNDKAQVQIAALKDKWPEGSLEAARVRLPYKNQDILTRVLKAVGSAGLR